LIGGKSLKNMAKFKYLGTTIKVKIAFTRRLRAD
jgi:hypothetical protein